MVREELTRKNLSLLLKRLNGRLKASRPLVGFGVLIDNTIKGLTCLHEIMSRNLIEKLVLNEMLICCKQVCLSHWHYIYVTSKRRKEKIEQGIENSN